MSTVVDPPKRDRWARLRFSIIGPLLAAPPAPGELISALTALAAKSWRHPVSGLDVCFGVSTLERWYYVARSAADPVAALRDRLRGNLGRFPSLTPAAIDCLAIQYREHPGWTMQLHFDNLRVALAGSDSPLPSYPTLRRYLKAQAMFRQARSKRATEGALLARDRLDRLEVRSFEVEHVSALWHLDFHHGSRKVLTRAGTWVKPMLLGVIDDRSRLVCHLQWYLDETAQSLVHGLSQAFMKRGLPRALMTMLEGEESLTLDLLNQATQAWVEQEYHRSIHTEIGTTPLAHYLAGPNGQRRRLLPVSTDLSLLPLSGIAPLLRQLLADYAATGLPPAYLPPPDKDPA